MNLPDPVQPPGLPFGQPYAPPPPPTFSTPQQPEPDGLAIAGMVVGIVGLFLGFFWVVLPILAVVLSAVALHRINDSNGWRSGRGMAIAGLTTGIVGVGFWGLIFLFLLPAGW